MSARLDPSWMVLASPSTPAVDRCVDIFARPDGTFGFEEFRRDSEDMGQWTPVAYFSVREFTTEAEARGADRVSVPWFPNVLDRFPGPTPNAGSGSKCSARDSPNPKPDAATQEVKTRRTPPEAVRT